MFTGIIEEVGELVSQRPLADGRELSVRCSRVLDDIKPEDSLSVNGVCLTVVRKEADRVHLQAVTETLKKSSTGALQPGARLHLERALLPTTRMGGHLVQGHVDCVGCVLDLQDARPGKSLRVGFASEFARYTPRTGSICLDGVSLTLTEEPMVEGSEAVLRVALIPFTLDHTLLGAKRSGDPVNLEFDCVAKYLEQLLKGGNREGSGGSLSLDRMRELGY